MIWATSKSSYLELLQKHSIAFNFYVRWLVFLFTAIIIQMHFIPVAIDTKQRFAAAQALFVVKMNGCVMDTVRLGWKHLGTILAQEKCG